uniref:Uncharacterized protein n=1 Tax=Tanacetum cinerariifolium TaxID=118510 RepID=A0A6L2JHB7_TANCI|nr:hypothetical protein [Tanacetum cinerariifolium]
MGIPTVGQTGELLPLPPLASIWKDLRLLGIGRSNVELESGSKKLREKLRQEKDTEEEAFEEFSSTLDNVLEKLSQENESPYDFYGLMYDTDGDASISGKSCEHFGWDWDSPGTEVDWLEKVDQARGLESPKKRWSRIKIQRKLDKDLLVIFVFGS